MGEQPFNTKPRLSRGQERHRHRGVQELWPKKMQIGCRALVFESLWAFSQISRANQVPAKARWHTPASSSTWGWGRQSICQVKGTWSPGGTRHCWGRGGQHSPRSAASGFNRRTEEPHSNGHLRGPFQLQGPDRLQAQSTYHSLSHNFPWGLHSAQHPLLGSKSASHT